MRKAPATATTDTFMPAGTLSRTSDSAASSSWNWPASSSIVMICTAGISARVLAQAWAGGRAGFCRGSATALLQRLPPPAVVPALSLWGVRDVKPTAPELCQLEPSRRMPAVLLVLLSR